MQCYMKLIILVGVYWNQYRNITLKPTTTREEEETTSNVLCKILHVLGFDECTGSVGGSMLSADLQQVRIFLNRTQQYRGIDCLCASFMTSDAAKHEW